MELNQQAAQKQQQTLKLSPHMMQSLSMLTMPVLDLRAHIIEEVEKNPALEIVSDEGADLGYDEDSEYRADAEYRADTEYDADSEYSSTPSPQTADKSETFNGVTENGAPSLHEESALYRNRTDASDAFNSFLENSPTHGETLQEHLLLQLAETPGLTKEEESLAQRIIQNLDERGFHIEPPETLFFAAVPTHARPLGEHVEPTARDSESSLKPPVSAAQQRGSTGSPLVSVPTHARSLGEHVEPTARDSASALKPLVPAARNSKTPALTGHQRALLRHALALVRGFDPVGTACADSRESLIVQAQLRPFAPKAALDLLQNHFALLSKPRASLLHKALPHYSEPDLTAALTFIRTLNPFPARGYGARDTQFAVPDVYVYVNDTDSADFADRFTVVLADENLPVPAISPLFGEIAAGTTTDEKTKAFVSAHINDATQFLAALTKRKTTIVAVATEIVRRQKAFFLGASPVPAPLLMQDVAAALNVHEATVSRAVNGKYVQCSRGLFELRYFFASSVAHSQKRTEKTTLLSAEHAPHIANGSFVSNGATAQFPSTAFRKSAQNETAAPNAQVSSINNTQNRTQNNAPAATPVNPTANASTKEAVKLQIKELLKAADANGTKLSDSKLAAQLAERGITVARRTVAKYRAELGEASSFDR